LLLEDWDVPEPFLAKNAWFRHRLDSFFEEHFCAIPQKFKGRMLFSTDTRLVSVRKIILFRLSAVEWGKKRDEDLAAGGKWDVSSE